MTSRDCLVRVNSATRRDTRVGIDDHAARDSRHERNTRCNVSNQKQFALFRPLAFNHSYAMAFYSKILRKMGPIVDPTEDYLNIVAAEEQMGHVEEIRQKEMDQVSSDLKGVYCTMSCYI